MSEKVWYKATKVIVSTSGIPLFQANETLVEILKTIKGKKRCPILL
jgi:hypothetical protein